MSKLLTLKDVCEQVHVTRKTVIRWIENNELKAFKLGSGGRLWRIRERDLQAFIRSQQPKGL
ncbi:MAG: helix-turn-helix domain-containing protein [Candidatus Aminicenantales bacterium]